MVLSFGFGSDEPPGHETDKQNDLDFNSAEFVSFSHDLEQWAELGAFTEGEPSSSKALDDGYKSAASEGAVEVSNKSGFSPTSLGEQQHGEVNLQGYACSSGNADVQISSDAGRVNFDAVLNVAFNSLSSEIPLQVWETGIWKHIFGDSEADLDYGVWGPQAHRPVPSAWGVDHKILEQADLESRKRSRAQTCNYMDVVAFKPDVPWTEQREADLQRGINLWIGVTSRWNPRCSFMEKLAEMEDEREVFNMFAHVFSGRAPATIRKRGHAVLRVCDHLETSNREPFPMTELILYRYLCSEKMAGAPSSRLMGVMQAMAFCRHVLDMAEIQPLLDSKRCAGVAKRVEPEGAKAGQPTYCTGAFATACSGRLRRG